MKKILIYGVSSLTHGAEFHLNQVLEALSVENEVTLILSESIELRNNSKKVNLLFWKFASNKVMSLFGLFFFIPLYSRIKKFDIVYFPWGTAPRIKNVMVVLGLHHPAMLFRGNDKTIHSIIQERFIEISIKNANFIKFPSNSFAKFVVDKYNIPKDRWVTIYHGINKERWLDEIDKCSNQDDIAKVNNSNRYFIFWSWFHRTKNLENLIISYSEYLKKTANNGFNLILAGKFTSKAYAEKIMALIEDCGIRKKIIFLNYPDFSILVRYINNSCGIILPFKYETFGYPYIESRVFNKPIGVAKNLVSEEITEGQCLYFDANSTEEFSNILLAMDTLSNKSMKYTISEKFNYENEIIQMRNMFNDLHI